MFSKRLEPDVIHIADVTVAMQCAVGNTLMNIQLLSLLFYRLSLGSTAMQAKTEECRSSDEIQFAVN